MNRIYVFVESALGEDVIGCALAEDGTVLAQHLCSTKEFVRLDLGVTSERKHRLYRDHYPQGFSLVDLSGYTDEQLLAHAGFQEACSRYEEAQHNERRTPKRGDARSQVHGAASGRGPGQLSLDLQYPGHS